MALKSDRISGPHWFGSDLDPDKDSHRDIKLDPDPGSH